MRAHQYMYAYSADMNIKENEITTNVVLNHTGDLVCFRANIIKITCSLDMRYFPFDMQVSIVECKLNK